MENRGEGLGEIWLSDVHRNLKVGRDVMGPPFVMKGPCGCDNHAALGLPCQLKQPRKVCGPSGICQIASPLPVRDMSVAHRRKVVRIQY